MKFIPIDRKAESAHHARAIGLILLLLGTLSFLQNCTPPTNPVLNNPNDSLTGAFVAPEISLLAGADTPIDNSNWRQRRTVFRWSGNSTTGTYSFKLDTAEWSPWSQATGVEYESLDDDVHVFWVKGRHTNESNETEPQRRSFTIDLLPHPSFFIVPNIVRPKAGDRFSLYLRVKNINLLMTMTTVLSYSRNIFAVEAIEVLQNFMTKNLGTVVAITSLDPNAGRIEANLGIALGKPKGVQGTGDLLRFQCRALSAGIDSLRIKMDSTVVKDTTGISVRIAGYANGRVIVQ